MSRWLELAKEFDGDNLLPIVGEPLSDNGISIVVRGEDGIYKRSIPFLIENELWCLEAMADSGFVPKVQRYDKYTLLLEDLGDSQPITDSGLFHKNLLRLLESLRDAGIRHGDLTTQAVIIRDNFPLLIDFAESRLFNDPRPDKRRDGDVGEADKIYQELVRRMGERTTLKIPQDRNTRAKAMWKIICPRVDFSNKNVIDLGCGYGDILRKIRRDERQDTSLTGLWGVDIDNRKSESWHYGHSTFVYQDINQWVKDNKSFPDKPNWQQLDIAMCFSVLPYLDNIATTLKWMSNNFELCLIEAQYAPEPHNVGVVSDNGMAQLLVNNGFTDVEPLGTTVVEGRFDDDDNPIERTIWMCK